MADRSRSTDKGLGLALAFGVLAVLGAVVMYAAPSQFDRALGFLLAIVAGALTVSAVGIFSG